MRPIKLNVPYHEREAAKSLGARWDHTQKTWYITSTPFAAAFRCWLPLESIPNARSNCFYIAHINKTCWHCQHLTDLYIFILPQGHQVCHPWWGEHSEWHVQNHAAIPWYSSYLCPNATAAIARLTQGYHYKYPREGYRPMHFMNHCAQCQGQLTDGDLFQANTSEAEPYVPEFDKALLYFIDLPVRFYCQHPTLPLPFFKEEL